MHPHINSFDPLIRLGISQLPGIFPHFSKFLNRKIEIVGDGIAKRNFCFNYT